MCLFYLYLNEFKREGLITVNRTAGLNMVYIHEKLSERQIFEKYFMECE